MIHPVQHYFFFFEVCNKHGQDPVEEVLAPACAGSGDRNCHSPKMAVARPDIDCVLANARNRFPAKYSQCKKEAEILSPRIERMQHLDSWQQRIYLEALPEVFDWLI